LPKTQMLFNVMDLIQEYNQSTNGSAQAAFDFILRHRRSVSKDLLKEMMLNYRTYFKPQQKRRIVTDYQKFIIKKLQQHTSDIAIGYNIVKYVKLADEDERIIIDYLYSRLEPHIDSVQARVYFLRKRSVLEYIENNILIKRKL